MGQHELETEKKALIEQIGVFLERENLSPLAARIMGTLILNGKKGITFGELVQDLHASKSTISTNLEYLQNIGKVKYFTKTGDRKRYFIINPLLMVTMIDETISKWEEEMQLHQKILAYKKLKNKVARKNNEEQINMDFQENYLAYLHEATAAIQKLRTKISKNY